MHIEANKTNFQFLLTLEDDKMMGVTLTSYLSVSRVCQDIDIHMNPMEALKVKSESINFSLSLVLIDRAS